MRIITRKRLREFARRHPSVAEPLHKWEQFVRQAEWQSLQDVRSVYRQADAVSVASDRIVTVFNIGGNKFRLIVAIHFNRGKVFVRHVLTHADYDRGEWKND